MPPSPSQRSMFFALVASLTFETLSPHPIRLRALGRVARVRSTMTTAVIVDALRTPGGKRNGKLRNWHAVDLATESLKALQARNDLNPGLVDDVVCGCVMQVGEQSLNIGRNAVLAAGWPPSGPATTVDRP